jgi:Fic family protein
LFIKSGTYEIQRDKAKIFYTFKPTPLCGVNLINTDEELTIFLSKAHRVLGILEGMTQFVPNVDAIESILLKKEALLSCQIDGSEASFEDVLHNSKKKNKYIFDIRNYIDAVLLSKSKILNDDISNRLLCDMHRVLVNDENSKTNGGFRRIQIFDKAAIYISDMRMYNPAAPEDINATMADLECYINSDDDIDVLIKIALIYYQFVTISPFENENNKIGRMLINLFLQKKKILSKQLLCLSSYTLLDKVGFFDRVSAVRIVGDYGQWVKCFLKAVIVSSEKSISIINGLIELKEKNQARIRECGQTEKTSLLILDYLEQNPVIDLQTTAEELKLAFNTVAKSVENLHELGIIKRGNNLMRNRCFVYEEYLEIIR